jgi:hypothetical protein
VFTFKNAIAGPKEAALKLMAYCQENDWAGYDPYDALNSKVFEALPFVDFRFARLALIQTLKRCPVNLRSVLRVPQTQNPKALALFLTSLLKLSRTGLLPDNNLARGMWDKLIELRSPDVKYWCWGYSFPWQTRTILVPRGAPNLVCTTFVAGALLDAYEQLGDARFLEMALSSGEYLLNELYYTEGDEIASFSYPLPSSKAKVHNANFLAASLLSRLYHHTRHDSLREVALKTARYSASRQRDDGSWYYGELTAQSWIDNFHTGYNLCALREVGRYLRISEFEVHVRRGFAFYRDHFFCNDGAVRYFHDRTYPIDIHCVAQGILTLLEFEDLDATNIDLVQLVYEWAMKHMWDKSGFFYYRVLRALTIRTSYLRWSQAWMLLALTSIVERAKKKQPQQRTQQLAAALI